jgi:hypothetical protein
MREITPAPKKTGQRLNKNHPVGRQNGQKNHRRFEKDGCQHHRVF